MQSNSPYAPVIAAIVGALAVLGGAYLNGRRQTDLEHLKWRRSRHDEFTKEIRTAVRELTGHLKSAAHSMCWLSWQGKFAIERLKQERVDLFDREMHEVLPKISGAHAVLAGMDERLHAELEPIVQETFALDAEIGQASASFDAANPATARRIGDFHGAVLELDRSIPTIVGRALSRYVPFNDGQHMHTDSKAFRAVSWIVWFVTGEFILDTWHWRNGSAVITARSIWGTFWIIALRLAVINLIVRETEWFTFDAHIARTQIGESGTWIAAAFAGLYTALYAKFSSQWSYLAGVYNEIKRAECAEKRDENKIAEWKHGLIVDARALHLENNSVFKHVIATWLQDERVAVLEAAQVQQVES